MTDLPAGRDLDALVAEKIMGQRVLEKRAKKAHFTGVNAPGRGPVAGWCASPDVISGGFRSWLERPPLTPV